MPFSAQAGAAVAAAAAAAAARTDNDLERPLPRPPTHGPRPWARPRWRLCTAKKSATAAIDTELQDMNTCHPVVPAQLCPVRRGGGFIDFAGVVDAEPCHMVSAVGEYTLEQFNEEDVYGDTERYPHACRYVRDSDVQCMCPL